MSRREAALRAQLGPVAEVVVARRDLPAGRTLQLADLGVRALPARYAPAGEPVFAAALAGQKLAVPVPQGGTVTAELLQRAPENRRSSAGSGRSRSSRAARSPRARAWTCSSRTEKETRLALQDVEVLAAKPAPAKEEGGARARAPRCGSRIKDAVFLVAAQAYAQDVQLLARIPGDTRTTEELTVGQGL